MIVPGDLSLYYAIPFNNQTSLYWIVAGADSIYTTDMNGTFTNVTRSNGNYSATQDINWNGGILGGEVAILNNGVDAPQSWGGSGLFQDLRYDAGNTWADVSYTTKLMRPFKSYLFALDVTKSGTRYPNIVKWSNSASAGTVPSTWDESDATQDAGETYLSDSVGFLVEALSLRDTLIIYGEGGTTGCQHIGGRFVFRFFNLFSDGIISRRCVKPIKDRHLVLALNDLILHDGQTPVSALDNRRKKWLFNLIDQDNYERSFIASNYRENELWVCFPQTGSTTADMALIWNYKDNSFSERELPNLNHLAYGIVDPGDSNIIDDQSGIIDDISSLIDARSYNPTVFYPLGLGSYIYQIDVTEQQDGTNMSAYVERLGMDFGTDKTKHVKRIIPKMTSTGSVTFSLALQKYPEGAVTYKSYTFNPNTDWKIDTRGTGRLIGYRIASSSNITWDFSSVEFEYEIVGDR